MKQLKKLSLQKEELMNLNAPEMDSVKGGTIPTPVSIVTTMSPETSPLWESLVTVTYTILTGEAYGDYGNSGGYEGNYGDYPYIP